MSLSRRDRTMLANMLRRADVEASKILRVDFVREGSVPPEPTALWVIVGEAPVVEVQHDERDILERPQSHYWRRVVDQLWQTGRLVDLEEQKARAEYEAMTPGGSPAPVATVVELSPADRALLQRIADGQPPRFVASIPGATEIELRAQRSAAERDRIETGAAHDREKARAEKAEAAIERVRALHERGEAYDGNLDFCKACVDHYGADWPCPTIRALDEGDVTTQEEAR